MSRKTIQFTLTSENAVEISETLGRYIKADNYTVRKWPIEVLPSKEDPAHMINVSVSEGKGLAIEHIGNPELPTIIIPFDSLVTVDTDGGGAFIYTEAETRAYIYTKQI